MIEAAIWILSVASANALVGVFGQSALVLTATVLLPIDFTVRDRLHSRWHKQGMVALCFRMSLMFLCGGLLSAAAADSARIAEASFFSIITASSVDAVVFHTLIRRRRFIRMATSNAVASAVDSVVFPLAAFGVVDFNLSAQQTALKALAGITLAFLATRTRHDDDNHTTP